MHPLAAELKNILGGEPIRTARYDPLVRTLFYKSVSVPDELRVEEPFTVVKVGSAEDISQVLRLANERREPVYVRQGMGLITPDLVRPEPPGSLVLDLSPMRWVRPNYQRAYVEVGPSVTEEELKRELAPNGYGFPDRIGVVTWVGSLISLNTSGRVVDPYAGKPRDYVMGLEAVLPTGEIVSTGTQGIRSVCGFDLGQLLIGGQCLFGVITNARLRLVPLPAETMGALVQYPSLRVVGEAVASLYRNRAPYPRLMELMDLNYLDVLDFDGPRAVALQLVAVDGDAPGEAEWKLDQVRAVLEKSGATKSHKTDKKEWKRLTCFREGLLTGLDARGLILLVTETVDCPLDLLPDALEATNELQKRVAARYSEVRPVIFGHIGSGSFHPSFVAPVSLGYQRIHDMAKVIRQQVLELKLSYGATVGEQGIFPEHREWYQGYNGQTHLNALRAIKNALDPNNILNPMRLQEPQAW